MMVDAKKRSLRSQEAQKQVLLVVGSAFLTCDSLGPSDMKAVVALSTVFKFREGRRRRNSTRYMYRPRSPGS